MCTNHPNIPHSGLLVKTVIASFWGDDSANLQLLTNQITVMHYCDNKWKCGFVSSSTCVYRELPSHHWGLMGELILSVGLPWLLLMLQE